MRHGLLTKLLLLGCAIAAFGRAPARADTVLYDNTLAANFTGQLYLNGGATSVGSTIATTMVADDITAGAGLGGLSVNKITFSIGNLNSTTVTVFPELVFYQADPNTLLPSTLITTVNAGLQILAPGENEVFSAVNNSAGGFFTMPTGLFWAGVIFTDGGTGGPLSPSAAQLNNLGQLIINPPDVGASNDFFFQSTASGPSGDAPPGTLFFFGGNPVANFGWGFTSNQAVPEPSTLALSAFGGLVLVGVRLTRRRRAAGDSAIAA
jgi:hypothetical protein